ncbi:MAG: GvpL/GvpF family gas vesicle protein [Thaumarchaeota archaeon]|nr:GvpL/GvpF family gas vesicle protein [Nitrososphaerota archaeon]
MERNKMINGKYLYGIVDGMHDFHFGNTALFSKQAYAIPYKDICAIVSNVPFKDMKPDADTITSHQIVIEETRNQGTTIPVRFGIMFKSDEGVKQMLVKSYKDLKSKLTKFKGKDEFGLKIVIDTKDLKKISVGTQNNPAIKKIKKEIDSSGKGTGYFLKMKMDEAVRNETYRKIEQLSGEIHSEISKTSQESCLLRSDFDQIVLNASYLIDKEQTSKFHAKIDTLRGRYRQEGLMFHLSGPWAPYSFC